MLYGEPPNLIMRANLSPHLNDAFFLRYCAPAAIAAYLVVARRLKKRLGNRWVDLDAMDVVDANAADVRFRQAMRHGEVLSPVGLVHDHAEDLEGRADAVLVRLRAGESLGLALIREGVPEVTRKKRLARPALRPRSGE